MPNPKKQVEYLERHGKVYCRVTRDLVGVRAVTSEMEVSDDPVAYAKTIHPVKIIGYHGTSSLQIKDPNAIAVHQLGSYLANVDSVDVLLRMRKLDTRKGSLKLYAERLNELLDGFSAPRMEK